MQAPCVVQGARDQTFKERITSTNGGSHGLDKGGTRTDYTNLF